MGANTNPKVTSALDLFNAVPERFTSDLEMEGSPGVEVVRSHVQGIARKDDYYLLTHSDIAGPSGLLLVARDERIVQTIRLPVPPIDGAVLNHPGGCQRIGDYLVIPFEAVERNVSRVSIFDVSTPERASELAVPAPIERGDRKAGAAGIANLTIEGAERWFLAIYDNGRVDLFRSAGSSFPDTEWRFQFAGSIPDGYESFCLLADQANRLFGVGFRRDSRRRNWAGLYRVHLDTERLELLREKRFVTNRLRNAHFRWGAGVDIRSLDDLALLCTGRNFLPSLVAGATGIVQDVQAPLSPPEAALLRLHCNIDTFSAT